jgi:outer membrane protein assembly factor BamB
VLLLAVVGIQVAPVVGLFADGADTDGVASAAAGDEEWSFSAANSVSSSPTVADGTVYVGSNDNNLYALDATDGSQKWSFSTGYDVVSSPTVADGTVYVGSDDNNVYALDATDGSEQWSFSTGDRIRSSPTVADGTVYVGSNDNNVYALTASGSGADSEGSRNLLGTLGHNGLFTADGTISGGEPLNGTVTDADGNPITDATVEAVNTSTGSVKGSTTTDSSGSYELSLPAGEYDISVSKTSSVYSNNTKTVTVPEGGKTVDFTLTSNTVVDSPSPSPGTTVSSGPVDLSVRVNSTNPSVSSIDVKFYEVTNDSADPENDTQIGSTTVAPDERAGVTWDPGGGTYEWYVVATADDGGTTVGGPYALAVGEAVVLEDSEQPTDGAIVDPSANVTVAVDVQTQDNATVSFYEFQTGNPANDQLIGLENVTNGTTTTSTVWNSTVRSSSDEWYVVLEDNTGVRDTAGAFSFGPGGQVVARDAETGAVIDDRTVRFETTYPGGSETFDRSSGTFDLSDSNAAAGDSIRIKVKTQDYYSRVVEVPDKQTDTDLYLERGANWSYSPSNDDPEDTASVENDSSRFISRFTLRDETGRHRQRQPGR